MTLKETIERFAHLDIVLGDPAWCAESLPWTTAHDLWEAVKAGAAEIDALAERNAFLLASAEAARRELAEARAQIAALTPDAEAWRYKQACQAWDKGQITPFEFAEAHKLYSPQARRAREARS